jgi:tyrosinase
MSADEKGELIGTGLSEVVIREASTEIRVELAPAALPKLASVATGARDVDRIYLTLEGIRGTRDATTLTVYLRFPDDGAFSRHPEFRAGTAALYGIRRASVRTPQGPGEGLDSTFDVTPFFRDLSPAMTSSGSELIVSIRLRKELPASAGITIGRVALFHKRYDEKPG